MDLVQITERILREITDCTGWDGATDGIEKFTSVI